MKFEVTLEKLEEYACCIVDCGLTRDEACDYIKSCVTGSDTFNPEENEDAEESQITLNEALNNLDEEFSE